MRKLDLLIRSIFRKNLITVFLQELTFALGTLVNGIIICRFLGSSAMAAVGIDSPFVSILAVFSGMIGIGCQAGCSKKIGEEKPQEVKNIFSTLLALSVILSAIFVAVFYFFAEPIVISWGARKASASDSAIFGMATDYLRASCFGIPGMILHYVFSPALILEGKRRYINCSTIVLSIATIGGDLLNIFVFHGGIAGIGIATSVAYTLTLIILLYGVFHNQNMFSFRASFIHISIIPSLLYLGISKAVRRACNAVRPIFLNQVIASLCGGIGLSALSVQGNIRAFLGVISAAIAGTMLSMAGVFYYEQDKDSIQDTYVEALRMNLFIAVPISLIFVAGAPLFVSLYVTDSVQVANLAVFAVRCYAAALPFVVFNEIYINYFQSIGNVPMASAVSIFSRVGMIAPCGLIALYLKSVKFAFLSLFISEATLSVCIILTLLIFVKGDTLLDKFSALPKNFGKDILKEKSYDTTAVGEAVKTIPEGIYNVCIDWGADKDDAIRASLFSEEFMLILLQNKQNSSRLINVRIIMRTDKTMELLIRNDCKLKDIQSDLDSHMTDQDYMRNATSEKIILFQSDDYNYSNTFGLNHFMIRIV